MDKSKWQKYIIYANKEVPNPLWYLSALEQDEEDRKLLLTHDTLWTFKDVVVSNDIIDNHIKVYIYKDKNKRTKRIKRDSKSMG